MYMYISVVAFRQPGGGGGGGGIHIYLEVHGQVCLSCEAMESVRGTAREQGNCTYIVYCIYMYIVHV